MSQTKLKQICIFLIAIYTGLIATACIHRYLDSLARHGTIQWSQLVYPIKLVLISVSIYVYFYLKKNIDLAGDHFFTALIKLSPLRLLILLASSIFAFWQYTPFQIFVSPTRILFFKW